MKRALSFPAFSARSLFQMGLCGAALSLSACLEDLPEVTRIEDLRILAIQAEPPEVAPGEEVKLSVLAVDPLNRPIRYQWYACILPESGSGLFGGSAETANSGGGNASLDRDTFGDSCVGRAEAGERWAYKLGESQDATFTIPADLFDTQDALKVAYELPANVDLDARVESAFYGIPGVNYRISVRVEVDGRMEEGQKLVNVSSPASRVDPAPNQNPSTPVFDVRLPQDKDQVPSSGTPHAEGACFTSNAPLAFSQDYLVTPLNLPTEYERYTVLLSSAGNDNFFELRQRDEQLFYSWFITEGELAKTISRTSTDPANTWTAPDSATSAQLWVVARDGRGGVAWCQQSLIIQ